MKKELIVEQLGKLEIVKKQIIERLRKFQGKSENCDHENDDAEKSKQPKCDYCGARFKERDAHPDTRRRHLVNNDYLNHCDALECKITHVELLHHFRMRNELDRELNRGVLRDINEELS